MKTILFLLISTAVFSQDSLRYDRAVSNHKTTTALMIGSLALGAASALYWLEADKLNPGYRNNRVAFVVFSSAIFVASSAILINSTIEMKILENRKYSAYVKPNGIVIRF